MPNLQLVQSDEQRAAFASLPGSPGVSPATLARQQPDALLLVQEEADGQARCALWWRQTPDLSGQRVGLIGHYAARDMGSAQALLDGACRLLRERACTLAVGPMDGGTHESYRFVTERGERPPFLLEPDNPPAFPAQWEANGFVPLARYYSTIAPVPGEENPRHAALMRRQTEEGVRLRAIDLEHADEELRRIHAIAEASFAENFLATPRSEGDFLAQYRALLPSVLPELVYIAENDERPLGVIFCLPDWLQRQRGEEVTTVIVKTLAVTPERQGHGLANALMSIAQEAYRRRGFTHAIHALMHENNASRHISDTFGGRDIRRYTLYARPLDDA